MTENALRDIRRLLNFVFPILGTSMLVFLRRDFGARGLGLKHLLFGAAALFIVAFMVEPDDQRDAARERTYAAKTVRECGGDLSKVLYPDFSCAEHLPPARALLAKPPDATPYMQYFLGGFVVVCSAQMLFARMRERWGYDSVHSYSEGEPMLSALTFGRFPVFGKVVLEPLAVLGLAWFADAQLGHHHTAGFFAITAGFLGLAAWDRWSRQRAAQQDFDDFQKETGIGEGSMLRSPTRFSAGGFWATLFKTREKNHVAGLRRLRAFAERNRQRRLEDDEEEPEAQEATSDAVPPVPSQSFRAAPPIAPDDDHKPRR